MRWLPIVLMISCSTSPTGRKQLTVFSDADMAKLGEKSFEQLKSELSIEKDPTTNGYVKCVAGQLTSKVSDGGDPNWEVVVFKEESANAFALPGGKIGIHTGLLKVALNQHQLAAVVGHEIAHVRAKHGNERVSQAFATQGVMSLIGVVTGDHPQKGLLMAALGVGAQFGYLMPHSRKQESEADQMGLEFMARAGFNPREAVDLWKNMANANKGSPPEFLSTHPSPGKRIEHLSSLMANATMTYEAARKAGSTPDCQAPRLEIGP